MTEAEDAPPPIRTAAIPGLRARVAVARLALIWEMIWLSLWRPASAMALFLVLSLFDVWRLAPAAVHALSLLALALYTGLTIYRRWAHIRMPSRRSILARIEHESGLRHQPLRALEDRQEAGAAAEEARGLWRAHLSRIRRSLPRLRYVLPRPGAIRLDRHGVRQMAGILLAAGLLTAGPQAWPRIAAGFIPPGFNTALPLSRLEAWITPPAYTGAAPVMLAGAALTEISQGQKAPAADRRPPDAPSNNTATVPAGAELSLRLFGGREAELLLTPETGKKQRLALTRADSANSYASVKLEHSLQAQLRQPGAGKREWRITVIPDQPPVISMLREITVTKQYSLQIRYGALDDYGVVSAAAEISLAQDKNASAAAPLQYELPLPGANKNGQVAYLDLTAHPWAGMPVRLGLTATDAIGQTGRTQPVELILPQRPFSNPLARAIIELRRAVAAEPPDDERAIRGLDALSLYPDKFTENLQIYLAMRVARHRISYLQDAKDIRPEAIGLLWRLALQIEDGDVSIAGNELRELQSELMQALRNGASEQEIARLTQALRDALARYMQALAEQALEDSMDGNLPSEGETAEGRQSVDPGDLEALLDQIEKLGKTGARQAAQDLLSKLQNILENLRAGTGGMQKNARQQALGKALEDLSGMLRQQQKLQDDTHHQQQQQGGSGLGNSGLAQSQEQLRGSLSDLMGELGKGGMQEGAPNALGRAESAMEEAAKALRKGAAEGALKRQGEAMDQLRAGAGALAKMLREEDARAGAENGDENGVPRGDKDPLGRPMASDPAGASTIPEQFDIERALQIRRELEQRASQRRRPPAELNYIDRLLKLF